MQRITQRILLPLTHKLSLFLVVLLSYGMVSGGIRSALAVDPPRHEATVVQLGDEKVPSQKFVVYLFIGHSNMHGRASDPDMEIHPRVWNFDLNRRPSQWLVAKGANVTNVDGKGRGKSGPAVPFLKLMANAYPGLYFGCINNAHSGGDIRGEYRKGRSSYEQIIHAAKKVQGQARLGGVVCMLGYKEAFERNTSERFGEDFRSMIRGMREDLGEPHLPFLISQYEVGAESKGRYWKMIRDHIDKIPGSVNHTAVIPTDGLSYEDDHHFDMAGHREWAARVVKIIQDRNWLSPPTGEANFLQTTSQRLEGKNHRDQSATNTSRETATGKNLTNGQESKGNNEAEQATIAEVDAVLVRTSKAQTARQIAPYTDAFIATEYEVKRVRKGELKAKHIVAMQFSMKQRDALPAARFKVGETHRLKLGLWSDQERYHGYPVSDDIQDFEATLYYVFDVEQRKDEEQSSRERSRDERSSRKRSSRKRSKDD